VFQKIKEVGIRIYPRLSSLTIIATMGAWRWHRSKCYTYIDVAHRSIGVSLERVIFGPNIVEEAEAIVSHIEENLKATKSRQETYANKRHRPLEFKVGDHVYLRVS
jgi:hypothetical protein